MGEAKDRTPDGSRPTQAGIRDPSLSHSGTVVKGQPRDTAPEGTQTATQNSGQTHSGRGRESNNPLQEGSHSKRSVKGHGQSQLSPAAREIGPGNPIQESRARTGTRNSDRSHSGTGGGRKVRNPPQEGSQNSNLYQPGTEPVAAQRISVEPVQSTGQQIGEQASVSTTVSLTTIHASIST